MASLEARNAKVKTYGEIEDAIKEVSELYYKAEESDSMNGVIEKEVARAMLAALNWAKGEGAVPFKRMLRNNSNAVGRAVLSHLSNTVEWKGKPV